MSTRPYQRTGKRRRTDVVSLGWTKAADTDLDFLASRLGMSRSAAAREAIRRAVRDELRMARVLKAAKVAP